ncbi:MAG: ABC-2 transporter permease [Oscillospiraceae bacterium]|nr:ABC-2 transporter permease [Oscillospiraceae bacterium]
MMNRTHPIRGLLIYSFYSVRSNLQIALLLTCALAVALLITGNTWVYNFFVLSAIGIPPYLIMISMGAKNQLQWEKYQASMPLRRKNMVAAFYLSVLSAALVGLVLCGVVLGVSFIFHEYMLHHVTETAFGQPAYVFGMALLMFALLAPIGSTKFGETRGEMFFTVCLGGALGIMLLISWLGSRAEMSAAVISLLQLIIATVAFVVSYHITSKIYADTDF